MGIKNREGALYFATGIDTTGLYKGKREAIGIIKAMAGEITSFDVFGGIGLSAGIAFARATKGAYDFEKQFQQSMKEVATLSSGIKGSLTDYMNQVLEITKSIPVQANDAAKALYQIVSAGHDGAKGMNILEVSAKAAIGGVTDTATAADAITTVLNAYKMDASQAERVSDLLFTTVRLGKTTFGELGHSIAQAAPIAASYGVEIDQVLAAVASLTKQGVPTAQAMTQIRASIIGVSKVLGDGAFNSRTYQEALEEVAKRAGGSESELRKLVPEVEAVNAVLGMTGQNARNAASDLQEMGNSTGAAKTAFQEMVTSVENQLKLLQNNITATLRPMGEAILKEISDVASAFNEAFENGDVQESIKTLGDLIVTVTGAFIGYKGSIVATTAAKTLYNSVTKWIIQAKTQEAARLVLSGKAYAAEASIIAKNTAMRVLLTNALKAQAAAALKASAAMLASPYTWAAVAVAGLGYAIYKYSTELSAAEKAQKKFNDEQKKFKQQEEERKQKIEDLIRIIQDETETEYAKIKAYEELQKYSPALVKAYKREELATLELSKSQKVLNEERDKANYQNIINQIEKYTQFVNKLKDAKTWVDLGKLQEPIKSEYGTGLLSNKLEQAEEDLKKWREDLREYNRLKKEVEENKKPIEIRLFNAKADIEQIQSEFDKAKKKLEEEQAKLKDNPFYIIPFQVQIAFDSAKDKLDAQQNKVSSLEEQHTKKSTYQRDLSEAKTNWEKAKKGYDMLIKDQNATSEQVKNARNDMRDKEKAYYELAGVTSGSLNKQENQAEKLRKEQDKYKLLLDKQALDKRRSAEDLQMQVDETRIKAMQDGSKKTIAQMELDNKKEIQQLERQKEDYIRNSIQAEREKFEANPSNKGKSFNPSTVSVNASSFDSIITNTKVRQKNDEIKEHQQAWENYLIEYGSFLQKKEALTVQYNAKINEASTQGEKESLKKELSTKLKELNFNELKDSLNFADVFGDLDSQTTTALTSLRDKLKEYINKAAKDLKPEDLKELQDAFKNIDFKIAERNPFEEFKNGLEEYKDSCKEIEKAQNVLNATQQFGFTTVQQYDKETGKVTYSLITQKQAEKDLANAQSDRQKSLSKLTQSANSIGSKGMEVVNAGNQLVDMLGNLGVEIPEAVGETLDGVGQIMSGLERIDLTKPFSAVTGMIGILSGVGNTIAGLLGFGNKANELTEQQIREYESLSDAMDKCIDRHKALMDELTNEEAVTEYEKSIELTKRKIEATKKIGEDYMNSNAKRSHTYGYKMRKDIEPYRAELAAIGIDLDSLGGRLENIFSLSVDKLKLLQETSAWGVLDKQTQEYIQTLIDADEKVKELGDDLNENLTQTSFDSVFNNFLDMLTDMDSSSEDFADNFEEYMRNAILRSMLVKNYQGQIKEWYKKFSAANKDGIDDKEYEELKQEWNGIVSDAKRDADTLKDDFGWNSSSSQSSTRKSYETVSQDSIEETNGRLTAIQITGEEIKNQVTIQTGVQQEILQKLEFIRNFDYSLTTEMRDMMGDVLVYLYDIKKDTVHLYFMRESLESIEKNTRGLNTR